MVISGEYENNPENNLKLRALNYILSLHMIERLREQEGGVYSPSVNLTNSKFPRMTYEFSVYFGCAPENLDKLIAAAWEEIAKLKENGPSDDDRNKFLAEERVGIKNDLKNNAFWLDYLVRQCQNNGDPKLILGFNAMLDGLTKTELKAAMNIYLTDKNYVRMVLLPENERHKQ